MPSPLEKAVLNLVNVKDPSINHFGTLLILTVGGYKINQLQLHSTKTPGGLQMLRRETSLRWAISCILCRSCFSLTKWITLRRGAETRHYGTLWCTRALWSWDCNYIFLGVFFINLILTYMVCFYCMWADHYGISFGINKVASIYLDNNLTDLLFFLISFYWTL